jgi:O-antigen/teichoic acid export membrane protein
MEHMHDDFSKFVKGFSITGVGVIYSAIMFYGSAFLSVNLLGPTQYGLFSLAFMVPNIAMYFLLFGLDVTAARFIAHHLGKNEKEKALECAQTIFWARLFIASASMILFFSLSGPLARVLGEDISQGLRFLSFYLFAYLMAKYLMAILQGHFLLKERTITESLTNTTNLLLLLPFVSMGFGYIAPILAFMCAFTFSIGISLYYLKRAQISVLNFSFAGFHALKTYLQFSFFVYLSESFHITYVWVGTIVISIYSLPIETVGYYRAMFSITNVIILVSYGLTIVLFPMLSELNARKEHARLAFSLRKVIKYTFLLSIPAALGMFFISEHFISLFFPRYKSAVNLLQIFSFRMIWLPLWHILATALLTLEREKKQALLSLLLVVLSFLLSMSLGIYSVEGIAVANTISLAVVVFLQYRLLKRRIMHLDAGPLFKFCISSLVMCVGVYTFLHMGLPPLLKLFGSLVCGALIYAFMVLKTHAITEEDLDLMESGLSILGKLNAFLNPLFRLARWIQRT